MVATTATYLKFNLEQLTNPYVERDLHKYNYSPFQQFALLNLRYPVLHRDKEEDEHSSPKIRNYNTLHYIRLH